MPYISVSANGEEIDRIELKSAMTVGRAPDCELALRDILLSRHHCRLEPVKNRDKHRWRVIDLESRNGSHVNYRKISNYVLVDGDVVRIGRTRITFKTGIFSPLTDAPKKNKLIRPADPHEALSGTVSDFVYAEPESNEEFDATPSPVSRDRDVPLTGGGGLGEATQPWSAVAIAHQPRKLARPMPRSRSEIAVGSRSSHTDLSLQVHESQVLEPETVPVVKRRGAHHVVSAMILSAGILLATAAVMVSGWVLMR